MSDLFAQEHPNLRIPTSTNPVLLKWDITSTELYCNVPGAAVPKKLRQLFVKTCIFWMGRGDASHNRKTMLELCAAREPL